MSFDNLGRKSFVLMLAFALLLAAACQPAAGEGPTGRGSEASDPVAGAGMLWYDGSILVYSPEQDAWIGLLGSLLGVHAPEIGVLLANHPGDNIGLAADYCASVGASGIVGSASDYLCEFKDPVLYPPHCETRDSPSGGYIGPHELGHAGLNTLDEYVEPGMSAPPSDFSIRSTFCSSGVGGLSFDSTGPVSDADAYHVTTDGVDMDCAVVDGRLACTGGKADSTVSITICGSPGSSDPISDGSAACPGGYLKSFDGVCKYSPVDRPSDSGGAGADATETPSPIAILHATIPSATATTPACEKLNYAYDPKAGSCRPLDEAFPCEEPGKVRMLYGRCEPRCANGFTPDYKGGCLPCSAGLSSNGGMCYVCPDGMISVQGGICVSYDDFYKTKAAPKLATEQASVDATKTAAQSSWLTEFPKAQTQAVQTGEAMIQTFRAPWTQEAQTQAALEVTETALAVKLAATATPTPAELACENGGTLSGGICKCIPGYGGPTCATRECPADTLFMGYEDESTKPICLPVAYSWISSCPPGYYFDETSGDCLSPGGKSSSSCFGRVLSPDELAACYPSGCLPGSTFEPALQCCRSVPTPAAESESCATLTVHMPTCETHRPGGGCSQYGPNDCAPNGCTWDVQTNSCK